MSSIITSKTNRSSILKKYSATERDIIKNATINKVRFTIPKEKGLIGVVNEAIHGGNYGPCNEFIEFLTKSTLDDSEFLKIITESRQSISLLKPTFAVLVEALLSLDWINRNENIANEYSEFYVELLLAHTKYTSIGILNLINLWIPNEKDSSNWQNGSPNPETNRKLDMVHKILMKLLNVIPMTYDVVLKSIETCFPYFKKKTHIVTGYLFNVFRLMESQPVFKKNLIPWMFRKLLIIDVNVTRDAIELAEIDSNDVTSDAAMQFELDECSINDEQTMKHPLAETLDIFMEKMFELIDKLELDSSCSSNFEIFLTVFEDLLLLSHNTHHVQFLIFYYCSLKQLYAEIFIKSLWGKVVDPNVPSSIRNASISYLASFLARSKYVPLMKFKEYLGDMCSFAHQYIQRCDLVRMNYSLKSNLIFFSVCQAIFYLIAFRSRDLTRHKKDMMFLQSLQLSGLVTSNLNPLRVCVPAIATNFASVTRLHQLAYCQTILERNARKKLATVYGNETSMPDECLETFFPFDPYLLKKSGSRITGIYIQYHGNDCEDYHISNNRKRRDGDMESEAVDDEDDFIIDKKVRIVSELSKSQDKEMMFTYGLSPGFHC